MNGWDVVAAIGAATGVPALVWQIHAQLHTWRGQRPDLRVTVASAFPMYVGRGAGEHHFGVTGANHGGSAAVGMAWGFQLPRGAGDLVLLQQLPWSTQLPATVAPQASVTFYIEARNVFEKCQEQGIKPAELVPWVRLATGIEVLGEHLRWRES
jgi:hypothetical protein